MNFEITITPFFASPLAPPYRRCRDRYVLLFSSSFLLRSCVQPITSFSSSDSFSPPSFIRPRNSLSDFCFISAPFSFYVASLLSSVMLALPRLRRETFLRGSLASTSCLLLHHYAATPFSSLSSASPTMLLLPLRNNFYLLLLTRSVSVFLSLCPSFFLCFSFSLLFPTLFLNPPTDRLILDLADLAFIRARLLKPLCASTSGIYRGRMTREHASHSRYRTDAKSR